MFHTSVLSFSIAERYSFSLTARFIAFISAFEERLHGRSSNRASFATDTSFCVMSISLLFWYTFSLPLIIIYDLGFCNGFHMIS